MGDQKDHFTQDVCQRMAEVTPIPLIFTLSNPQSVAECTAEQAYTFTKGKCLFAAGYPAEPVDIELDSGAIQTMHAGLASNAFVYPGLVLGCLAAGVTKLDNRLLYVAAQTLAEQVEEAELTNGRLYPPADRMHVVARHIACAVAKTAVEIEVTRKKKLRADIANLVDARQTTIVEEYLPIFTSG